MYEVTLRLSLSGDVLQQEQPAGNGQVTHKDKVNVILQVGVENWNNLTKLSV